MIYSIIALIIRLFLSFQFWQEGQFALKSQTRTFGNAVMLASTVSLLLGFYVYLFTLILLMYLGVGIWRQSRGKLRFGVQEFLLLLTFLLFLKGPGQFSLDKLLGNI